MDHKVNYSFLVKHFDKKNSEWNIIDGGLFDFFNPSKGIFNEKIFNYIKITKQIFLK